MKRKQNMLFLTQMLAFTDLKVRFNGSALGYLWYLLKPLIMFSVLYVVFGHFFKRFDLPSYPLYLITGLIVWDFFASTSKIAMDSLYAKAGLLTTIYFPRSLVVFSAVATGIWTLAFNLVVLAIFFLLSEVSLTLTALWMVPLLAIEIAFVTGVSLALAALNLRYRDLSHIWEVLLQIGFWATPIIYPLEIVPPKYQAVLSCNPMAAVITGARSALIDGVPPSVVGTAAAALVAIVVLVAGWFTFAYFEPRFVEEL